MHSLIARHIVQSYQSSKRVRQKFTNRSGWKYCPNIYWKGCNTKTSREAGSPTGQDENTVPIYTGRDSTPKQVGNQLQTNKLGPVVERQFGFTIQEVLTQTPKSHIIQKPTSAQKLREKRKMLRQVRDQIQSEYDHNDESFVMQNRISWNLFDKMRKKWGIWGQNY